MRRHDFPPSFLLAIPLWCWLGIAADGAVPRKTVFRQDWRDYEGVEERRLLKTGQTAVTTIITLDGGHGGTPAVFGNDGLVISYLKFNDLFGDESGQIPPGAHIIRATLTLTTSIGPDHQSASWFAPAALTAPLPAPADGLSILESFSQTPGTYRGPDFPDGHVRRPDTTFHSPLEPALRLDQGESASSDVTETVRDWAEDPERNHGFIIWPLPTGTDNWSYYSSLGGLEDAHRPTLEIEWLPAADAAALGAATKVFRQGLHGYDGTVSVSLPDTVTPINAPNFAELAVRAPRNGYARTVFTSIDGQDGEGTSADDQMIIQFNDLFGAGEHQIERRPYLKIARAVLRLTSGPTGGVDPYAEPPVAPNYVRSGSLTYVHRMLVPWYEQAETRTIFTPYAGFKGGQGPSEEEGEISPPLSFYTGTTYDQKSSADVTEAVRAWAAGEPNHGLNLQMEGADGWGVFFPGVEDPEARPELVVTYYYEVDTDGDGLPDVWELASGTDPEVPDADADPDGDGLTNREEYQRGTRADLADTDGDGLSDKVETNTGRWVSIDDTGTDPLHADTDGDGLPDGVENPDLPFVDAAQPGTSPLREDTDGDGFSDSTEVLAGSHPRVASNVPAFTYEVVLAEDFDGGSLNSRHVFESATNGDFYPDVFDSELAGYGMAAQFTDAADRATVTNSSLAWDHVPTAAPAWRVSFDYFLSADPEEGEAGEGFGFGFYRIATYESEGSINPGRTPRQWDDPRAGGGHPDAVVFGFDLAPGPVEGNTVRLAGPANPTAGLRHVISPFPLNNGVFNRAVVTAFTSGPDTVFSLELTEDVSGDAPLTHRLIDQVLARDFDLRAEKIRLIFGARTSALNKVTSFVDNVVFETGAAVPGGREWQSAFRITGVIRDGDHVALTWESVADATYQVERSTTLADGEWTLVAPAVAGEAGTTTYSDPLPSPPSGPLFYRVTGRLRL